MRYKILPLTISQFKKKYNVSHETLCFAYGRYLLENRDIHHYNKVSIKQWYKNQF